MFSVFIRLGNMGDFDSEQVGGALGALESEVFKMFPLND